MHGLTSSKMHFPAKESLCSFDLRSSKSRNAFTIHSLNSVYTSLDHTGVRLTKSLFLKLGNSYSKIYTMVSRYSPHLQTTISVLPKRVYPFKSNRSNSFAFLVTSRRHPSRSYPCTLIITCVHADYQAKAGDSSVLQRPLKTELQPSEIRDVFGFPRNLRELYSLGPVLGAGSFGVVRECTERSTGRKFAVKSIPKQPKNAKATPRYLLKLQTEVDAMGQLGASLDAVYLKDVFEDDAAVHLIMELCEGGSVLDRLKDGEYSERQVVSIMKSVLRFLGQCHSKGLVYRDVKPENFMLLQREPGTTSNEALKASQQQQWEQGRASKRIDTGGNGNLWNTFTKAFAPKDNNNTKNNTVSDGAGALSSPVKATDFGLSIRHRHGEPKLKSRSGTPAYMAPEVIQQCYDESADIWSAGIMMYQLLTGRFPFWENVRECSLQQVWKSILTDRINFDAPELRQISPAALDLLKQMLERNPIKRISAADALKHPWLRTEEAASALPLRSSVVQRLQRFATYGHLKQLVFRLIAGQLRDHPSALPESRELVDALTGLFHELDVDASGSVSMDELVLGLERLGYDVSASELEHLMQRVDTNHDGSLQLAEFVAGLVDWHALQQDDQWSSWVALAFDRLDKNKDGYISLSSLEELLDDASLSTISTSLGNFGSAAASSESNSSGGSSDDTHGTTEGSKGGLREEDKLLEARRMLREADVNGDGRVSRQEFADMLTAGSVSDGLNQYDSRLRGVPTDLTSIDEELGHIDGADSDV